MKRFVPLSIPNFNGNEKYVDDALEQGWVSTGALYYQAGTAAGRILKVDKAAACQSGTSGRTWHSWSAVCSRETW
ncbi:MAG: hypothetical protein ACLR7N_03815 [Roseburia hominis]